MNTQPATTSETLTQNDLLQSKRTRCEVWTRVMGYHRPVDNFNVGKKSEHYSRNHFSEQATINSKFCQQFA